MTWFPITDLSRAEDIRMRRRRALLLLGSIAFVPWMLWGDRHATRPLSQAHVAMTSGQRGRGAAEIRRVLADSLRIDLPCASQVDVLPDPTLSGQAVISAPDSVLEALAIGGGSITGHDGCADDSPVTIRTGSVMPLVLVQSGSNDLHAGRFDGAVTVQTSGSGAVNLDHAGSLTVQADSSADIAVGSVTGVVTATMEGSGDLRIDGGTIPVLQATSHSSGDVLLDRVRVLGGRVILDGSGDLRLGGSAGTFEAETHGSGTISITAVDNDRLTLVGEGSGDISVGSGHIGTLVATRHGSGDLVVDAAVDGGELAHSGSGDVSVPRADTLIRHN